MGDDTNDAMRMAMMGMTIVVMVWGDHDERLSEWHSHVGSQQVEVVGGV